MVVEQLLIMVPADLLCGWLYIAAVMHGNVVNFNTKFVGAQCTIHWHLLLCSAKIAKSPVVVTFVYTKL